MDNSDFLVFFVGVIGVPAIILIRFLALKTKSTKSISDSNKVRERIFIVIAIVFIIAALLFFKASMDAVSG